MVMEITYNVSGLTDEEINTIALTAQNNKTAVKESVVPSMKQLQTSYSINDFDLVYRYKTADGIVITDLLIELD